MPSQSYDCKILRKEPIKTARAHSQVKECAGGDYDKYMTNYLNQNPEEQTHGGHSCGFYLATLFWIIEAESQPKKILKTKFDGQKGKLMKESWPHWAQI